MCKITETEHNTTIRSNANLPTPHAEMPPARVAQLNELTFENSRPVERGNSLPTPTTFAEDDIDIDQLAEIEAQFTDNSAKRQLDTAERNPGKKLKMDSMVTTNRVDDYPDENDIFMEEDEDYLRLMEEKFDAENSKPTFTANKGPITVSSEPYVYIKQINDMKESDRIGKVFKVKGQIMKLLSKLSVGKDAWSLRCTIVDGTGCIDVDFTSDVLSKLVGFTPQEMHDIKKRMSTEPAMKEKAVSVSLICG